MNIFHKNTLARKRRWRIRKKVIGSAERPRLAVRFTNKHIYAQCIDDRAGRTLASASSLVKGGDAGTKPNREGAEKLGKQIAEAAKAAGIEAVVFDRAGRRYHGTVKTFADAAREGGLKF